MILYLLLSFVIPFIILFLAYTLNGIGFLGNKSVLVGDLRDQYVNFYSQYQTILRSGDFSKLLYSWNLGFGGNFLGLFTYYLASPVSLLVLLFPKDQLAAIIDMRKNGLEPLGNWHSHPETPARPSKEDIRLAFDSEASYLIMSLMDQENPVIHAFRVREGQVSKDEIVTI